MKNNYSIEVEKVPVTWDIEKIKKLDTWYLPKFINKKGVAEAEKLRYLPIGHNDILRTPVFSYKNSNEYSETLRTFPNYHHAVAWFQNQRPGRIFKEHIDPCLPFTFNDYWKSFHGLEFDIEDSRFRRAIIYLSDHAPGHFTVVNGKMFYDWSAGDMLYWGHILHTGGNFGTTDKVTMIVDYYI
jgi:hypothetical protein